MIRGTNVHKDGALPGRIHLGWFEADGSATTTRDVTERKRANMP